MDSSTSLQNAHKRSSAGEKGQVHGRKSRIWRGVAIVLWVIGLVTLITASVLTHNHPGPWPIEVTFSQAVQHVHYWPWVIAVLDFVGTFNNPTPTGVVLGIICAAILLMGWYLQAAFLVLTVAVGNGLDALIGNYVLRPRPSPTLVHVDVPLLYNSFPSGHACHMMVFYGSLLYLSFTRPVRTWKYYWVLIPFQVFAVLNILLMGYSRVFEGEHWLGDVLAGYLSGALWLTLFIFLYQWATKFVERRRSKRMEMQSIA